MDRLLGYFGHGQGDDFKVRNDDDMVDRLSHRHSTLFLVLLGIMVTTRSFVGEMIECWCPAHFTHHHRDFAEKLCWISNTYYISMDKKELLDADQPRQRISYYQWVPMILFLQALLFYLPCMAWRVLNRRAGVDINSMVSHARDLQHNSYFGVRKENVRFTAQYLNAYLETTKPYRTGCLDKCKRFISSHVCIIVGRGYGNYLVVIYMLIKLLYLLNAVGQLFLLNAVLSNKYYVYGYEVLIKLFSNQEMSTSERFPRVTICDFYIRQLGNIHRHSIQCVLPINFFNEKIFIVVWFWLVFVAVATIVSFMTWLAHFASSRGRLRYISQHLKARNELMIKQGLQYGAVGRTKRELRHFVFDHLRQDGVFIIKLIGINANQLITAEILGDLWDIRPIRTDSRIEEV